MSQENREIVRTSVAVVIAACLLKVGVAGVGWDDTTADTKAHPVSEQVTLDVAAATKVCGDFLGRPGTIPIRVEVVEGNVPCRVARRVMKHRYYRQAPTGLWSCDGGGLMVGSLFTECEKNRGRQGMIRARLYCPYWGPHRSLCSKLMAALREARVRGGEPPPRP